MYKKNGDANLKCALKLNNLINYSTPLCAVCPLSLMVLEISQSFRKHQAALSQSRPWHIFKLVEHVNTTIMCISTSRIFFQIHRTRRHSGGWCRSFTHTTRVCTVQVHFAVPHHTVLSTPCRRHPLWSRRGPGPLQVCRRRRRTTSTRLRRLPLLIRHLESHTTAGAVGGPAPTPPHSRSAAELRDKATNQCRVSPGHWCRTALRERIDERERESSAQLAERPADRLRLTSGTSSTSAVFGGLLPHQSCQTKCARKLPS